jgi:hypothetical protein
MEVRRLTFDALRTVLKRKGYKIYERPYELNIVGVRSPSTAPNKFDDAIFVFYKNENKNWVYHAFPATTDPGTYWLRQPSEPQGTGILAEGQYEGVYQIGLHRGKYIALVQRLGTVTVIRDYNRDAILDFNNGTRQTGYFGINIHHANSEGVTKKVDRYSAGCQVLANIEDFNKLMILANHQSDLYGNSFTYTLIDLRTVQKIARRARVAIYGGVALGLLGLLAFAFNDNKKLHT